MMKSILAITGAGAGLLLLLAVLLRASPDPQTPHDPPALDWGERIEVASGPAFRGPWRMNESEFHHVDDTTVAICGQGMIGVAWVDQTRKDIFLQLYDAGGNPHLDEPVNVSGSPRIFSWLPRIALAPGAGEIYVLWQEIIFSGGSHGGEILFARSTDRGATFSEPLNLSNTTAGAGKGRLTRQRWDNGSLDLIRDAAGALYAAWTEYEGALRFSRSTDGGASFTAPVLVAGGEGALPARAPALAVDSGGTIFLAWTVGEDRAANIHWTASADGGQSFDPPRVAHETRGHADAPRLAVDSKDTLHLVFAESSGRGGYRIFHSRLDRDRQSFAAPREIPGPRPAAFASEHFPEIAADGQDRLYLLWELFPRQGPRPQGLAFALSTDGGDTFETARVPAIADPALGINGSLQGLLTRKLAVHPSGQAAIVNSTFRERESSQVWLMLVKPAD